MRSRSANRSRFTLISNAILERSPRVGSRRIDDSMLEEDVEGGRWKVWLQKRQAGLFPARPIRDKTANGVIT